jgi:hypothetical protein
MTYEGGKTDVDDFKGGRIHYAGIVFGYQQQEIFWQAVGRYLAQKAHEVFRRWESETSAYPMDKRLVSLDGTGRITETFARKVLSRARETATAVSRGKLDMGYSPALQAIAEVSRLTQAHRDLLQGAAAISDAPPPKGIWKWIEDFYANNKGLIWLSGIVAGGIMGGIALSLKIFGLPSLLP